MLTFRLNRVSLISDFHSSTDMTALFYFARSKRIPFLFPVLFSIVVSGCEAPVAQGPIHIPVIEGLCVDGSGGEYTHAYHAHLAGTPQGDVVAPEDLDINLSIGWTEEGLALFAEVTDDTIVAGRWHAWEGDGLEIFIADSCGSESTIQFSIAVLNPLEADTGLEVFDRRYGMTYITGDAGQLFPPACCKIGKTITDDGYQMEVLLPFEVLFGKDSIPGSVALEVWVNDADTTAGPRAQYTWSYSGKMLLTSWAMQSLIPDTLASETRLPVRAQVVDEMQINMQFPTEPDLTLLEFVDQDGQELQHHISGRNASGYLSVTLVPKDWEMLDYISVKRGDHEEARLYADLISRVYEHTVKPNRYEEDVRCLSFRDRRVSPPQGATLFVGSSSIVMWKTLSRDMQGMPVLNRGFGGSTADDLLYYFDRIVLPYKPERIIYYEGDNDMGNGTAPEVFADSTRRFIQLVKEKFPDTKIYLLSIKPSFARIRLAQKVDKANMLLRDIAGADDSVYFIDVSTPMYDSEGRLRKDIFLEDGLHMNAAGYEIWTRVVRESLGMPALSGEQCP